MGFWHTGYAEFHEPTGLDDYVYTPSPPVRYVCEHCAASFTALEDLRRHRFESHPLRQPALWLQGRAAGALPIMVFSALCPEDVVVEDTTQCTVNGQDVTVSQLGAHLAFMSHQFVEIELANSGAVTRCVLDFRIADEKHLHHVEEAFLRLVRDRALTADALGRFIQDCRTFKDAMPYCDGICHYLYGVMAKEKSVESGLRQGQYVERFIRAREELAGFSRPLARSILALISFHFNHFREAESLAHEGSLLRHAAGAFADLLDGLPWHHEFASLPSTGSAIEDLLTDQDTLQVLSDARHSLLGLKEHSDGLVEHLKRASAGYDRLKRVLLASEALAKKDDNTSHAAARKLAREMASQPETHAWAIAMLERFKTP